MDLLIVGGNAPETSALDLTLADLLRQAGDPTDAATYYQKAIEQTGLTEPAQPQ
jgi:hypothetical protein